MADEGAFSVLTGPTEADVRIQVALIDINTSLHVFGRHEPIIAQAPVLSRNVCALAAITDIGVIFTLINVCARSLVWHQREAWLTATFIAPVRVCAEGLTATIHYAALINVDTEKPIVSGVIARVAGTLVLPYEVHTTPVGTEVGTQFALVDVNACGDVGRQLVARRTFTAITSLCVVADASSTEERISLAFINIHAVLHHHKATFIAFVALAFEVPRGVHTLASATEVRRYAALVNVCAVPLFRVQSKAAVTPALEAANGVPALAVGTEAGYHLALVNVFEERFPICYVFRGKPGSSGTEFLILPAVSQRTLFTLFCSPGCPNGAAAGIHSVAASNGQRALLVVVLQEAGLQADIKADSSCSIQSHSTGTLALERTPGVNTQAILAYSREYFTLIDIFTLRAFNSRVPFTTYGINLTYSARAPPGSAKGGAAFGLQGGSIDIDLTSPVDDSLPASALDGFYADGFCWIQSTFRRAFANERPRAVLADSINARTRFTFINVFTGL